MFGHKTQASKIKIHNLLAKYINQYDNEVINKILILNLCGLNKDIAENSRLIWPR